MNSRTRIETLPSLAYSVDDGARVIGVGPAAVWKWIAEKKLPVIKIGRRTIIKHDDLEAFLESHREAKPEVNLEELGML